MNTSVIRYRVADFLKAHAPFDSLPSQQLVDLAGQGRVKFHETDEFIFQKGQAKAAWVWVVQQGRIELVDESSRLLDVLGEGDLLGLERFIGDGSYVSSARTVGDVIVYAIDARAFEDLAARYPAVKRFLAAHFSVSGAGIGRRSWLDADPPGLDFLEARTKPTALGEQDLAWIPTSFTTRTAVRKMIEAHSDALSVGTSAILTATDLALFCDRNPMFLLREIRHASNVAELAPLLLQGGRMIAEGLAQSSDVDDCSLIASEIVAASAAACIRFAHEDAIAAGMEPPPERFCWLAFGKMARGEMLQMAPPQVGVVYEESADPTAATLYFNTVVGQVGAWFHACGLQGAVPDWPEGAHPCMTLKEWKRFFQSTIRKPFEYNLFARRELFDFRSLSGDKSLLERLAADISRELAQANALVPLLANDTLGNLPPQTVFRGLVLDRDGSEHETLDLAEYVLNPISGAARVFVLGRPVPPAMTLDRLEFAAHSYPEKAAVFQEAAEAFRIALFYQTVSGSPVIQPSRFGKLDQRVMKSVFAAVLRLLELAESTFVEAQ